jgi:hypothetical protein
MDTGWFITTYLSDVNAKPIPRRWCAMDNYTPQIFGEDGSWEEIEVGANFAIVKVKASTATLTAIAQDPLFTKIPGKFLTDSLTSLTQQQKNKVMNLLNQMGYSNQEIQNGLGGNITANTIGDILRFCATRRVPPRFDAAVKKIVFDLPHVPSNKNVDIVDRRVK